MSYARRMTRPDATQEAIVEALRKAGVSVWVIGHPVDLLTYHQGTWGLLECKPVKKRNRKDQARQTEWLQIFAVPVVRTAEDALKAVLDVSRGTSRITMAPDGTIGTWKQGFPDEMA